MICSSEKRLFLTSLGVLTPTELATRYGKDHNQNGV